MLAGEHHLFHVQHLLTFHPQPGFALLTVKVIVTHINTKANAAIVCAAHRHGECIIGIHHANFGIFINAQFGRTVLLQAERVSVHMIFGDV